jgi:putative ABC transport system substrate-binding protein
MRRRKFVTLLGGAAVGWPLAARAQQAKRPTIGYLGATTAAGERPRTDAFVQRLRELGWIEGETVEIQYRWGESRTELFPDLAVGLVRLRVDIIVAASTAAALACKEATAVIPIVFPLTGDPLSTGLVASLAHPGGNVTGLTNQASDIAGKRLEILRDVVPAFSRFGQYPISWSPIRDSRYSGSGAQTRPRRRCIRNPAS